MINTLITTLALLVLMTVGTDASLPVFLYGLFTVALHTSLILWLIGFLFLLSASIQATPNLKN